MTMEISELFTNIFPSLSTKYELRIVLEKGGGPKGRSISAVVELVRSIFVSMGKINSSLIFRGNTDCCALCGVALGSLYLQIRIGLSRKGGKSMGKVAELSFKRKIFLWFQYASAQCSSLSRIHSYCSTYNINIAASP